MHKDDAYLQSLWESTTPSDFIEKVIKWYKDTPSSLRDLDVSYVIATATGEDKYQKSVTPQAEDSLSSSIKVASLDMARNALDELSYSDVIKDDEIDIIEPFQTWLQYCVKAYLLEVFDAKGIEVMTSYCKIRQDQERHCLIFIVGVLLQKSAEMIGNCGISYNIANCIYQAISRLVMRHSTAVRVVSPERFRALVSSPNSAFELGLAFLGLKG